jgi:hypothetical protein
VSKVSYEQAYRDHQYLWETHGSAADMTGAYVDQEDLARLLKSPTKATARDCLVDQIEWWFTAGTDEDRNAPAKAMESDAMVRKIAERYDIC